MLIWIFLANFMPTVLNFIHASIQLCLVKIWMLTWINCTSGTMCDSYTIRCWQMFCMYYTSWQQKIKCDLYNYALLVPVLNTNVLEQVDVVRDIGCLWSLIGTFLLLARYVPNVAKRSIWEQCKKKYILRTDRRPTDRRPTTDLSFGKIQMTIYPQRVIRSTSCSVLGGVFGVGGSNGAISGLTKSKIAAHHLGNFKISISPKHIIRFTPPMGFSVSADGIALFLVGLISIRTCM